MIFVKTSKRRVGERTKPVWQQLQVSQGSTTDWRQRTSCRIDYTLYCLPLICKAAEWSM